MARQATTVIRSSLRRRYYRSLDLFSFEPSLSGAYLASRMRSQDRKEGSGALSNFPAAGVLFQVLINDLAFFHGMLTGTLLRLLVHPALRNPTWP